MKATLIKYKYEEGYTLLTGEENSIDVKFIASTSGMYVEYKLSKQNCDDLFGMVDIEPFIIEDSKGRTIYNESYELGFKRAMELYQPKAIEVEIEMEDKIAIDGHTKIGIEPQLDPDGCLILKKI